MNGFLCHMQELQVFFVKDGLFFAHSVDFSSYRLFVLCCFCCCLFHLYHISVNRLNCCMCTYHIWMRVTPDLSLFL